MALTAEGAWVARVDGAWIWQIQLPAPPPPPPEPVPPGKPIPPSPPPPPPPQVVGPLQWTPWSTLVFQDSNGVWQEADPVTTRISPLPAALQGTTGIAFSPDGSQVLYYKGRTLFVAQRDGSQPRRIGEDLIGHWGADSQLITTRANPPGPAAATTPAAPGATNR